MRLKALWKLSVRTSAQAEDAVTELLSNFSAEPAASYRDAETGVVNVMVFCPTRPTWTPARHAALRGELRKLSHCGLDIGSGRTSLTRVAPRNWAEAWKRHFKPIAIGSALLVKPSWSRRPPAKGQAVVILDPGLSFGTGQHPTTRFCFEQIVRSRKANRIQSFLDIGTGSGILSIAAAKLGYRPVGSFDLDRPQAKLPERHSRSVRLATKSNPAFE